MTSKTELTIDGYTIELSNLDKVMFPDDDITKGEMITYYKRIAHRMLPYLKGRALTLNRYPDGIRGETWFQKNTPDYFPDWIKTVKIAKEDGTSNYVVCEKTADLVYLANQAAITFHAWLGRYDKPKNPDLLIFDLDPSGDDFEPVREVAFSLHDLLSKLGLTPYLKTTGSRGLHVCCPLDRDAEFHVTHAFARDTAALVARSKPDVLTVEPRKDKRGGRVFIDALRNSYAQTAVVPYSLRARDGAPVAMPISWQKLADPKIVPQSYNIRNVFKQTRDPWAGMWRHAAGMAGPRVRLDSLMAGVTPKTRRSRIK